MNQYTITLRRYHEHPRAIVADTAGKAKYLLWLDLSECYENFFSFLRDVESCVKDFGFYDPQEAFRRTCENREIPFAKIGMKVRVGDRMGTIKGSNYSANLDVEFDGDDFVSNCHPHWNITYYSANGEVLAVYGKG